MNPRPPCSRAPRARRRPLLGRLVLQGLALLLLFGCGGGSGGGGGGGTTAVFDGGWWMTRNDTSPTCGAMPELALPVALTTTGTRVVLSTPLETLNGVVTGDTARFEDELILLDPVTRQRATYRDILLIRTGDIITGSARVRAPTTVSGIPVECDDTAQLKLVPEMRVVGFNVDLATEVPTNQPLVFEFTEDVDPTTINPDTIEITALVDPSFETTAVDRQRFALLPQIPNFADYADLGMVPPLTYDVRLPDYRAPHSIRSARGAPLVVEFVSQFTVGGNTLFVEPRRPLVHTPGPLATPPGRGDEDGCLNNADNSLYVAPGFQTGTDPSVELLCLANEGPPRVIPDLCIPAPDDLNVALGSSPTPPYNLPAIRIRLNEPVRPDDVVRTDPSGTLGLNVQLWRVGDTAANPIPLSAANQVATNRPLVVQSLERTEVILVALAPVPPGTYLVNVRGLVDLPGNPLVITDRPDPATGGYTAIDAGLAGVVPDGYRFYFRTP